MNATENTVRVEVLQPEISNQIQILTLEELKNWIKAGKLQPTHKVRIKNLNWIEAQKIAAFQSLFESKKKSLTAQTTFSLNQSLPETPGAKKTKSDFEETKAHSKKNTLSPAENSDKAAPKTTEHSVPFKIFTEKALAKSKAAAPKKPLEKSPENDLIQPKSAPSEPTAKPLKIQSEPQQKSTFVKQTFGFLVGCFLLFLLSIGGAYLWVYQLKSSAAVDEKNLPELSKLEDKLTSDKFELRLKTAANKQEFENSDKRSNSADQLDTSQEIAKLDKQFDVQRKVIVENYRRDLAANNFKNTFYFSFAVLLLLFLPARIFYGKTAPPIGNRDLPKSAEPQNFDSLNIPTTAGKKSNLENSKNISAAEPLDVHITNSPKPHSTKSSNKTELVDKVVRTAEISNPVEAPKSVNCLLHQDKAAQFVCENCANNFCVECLKTLKQIENCCPFCKIACQSVDTKINQPAVAQSTTELKKKTNLLDLGTNKDFVIYDFPENKTRKIGIIPAFVIALLFSAAISIFWVYKISTFLENRQKTVAENVTPNQTSKPAKNEQAKTFAQTAGNSLESANVPKNNETEANNAADKNCIDPETKQPFECDEETRRVLYEHTRKTQSVEKAQNQVAEKTNLVLGLVSSSAREESQKAQQELPKPNAIEEARKESDKQLLIKVFLYSFLTIFSLILSTRLFSKNQNS